jgi:hypothetical protein
MPLSVSCQLTDIFGNEWAFDVDSRIKLTYIRGIEGAEWDFDDLNGADQDGVTTADVTNKPNLIEAGMFLYHRSGGPDAREYLAEWRRANGRGGAFRSGGSLMRFTVVDTGRFQDVRLVRFNNKAEFTKMHDCGRAYDEVIWRSDESWWRTEPEVQTFTAAEFSGATVANNGDVDSWLHYKLEGPITNPRLGIGDEDILLPSLTAGQWLDIETNPDFWAIWDQAGVDRSWIGERWHDKAPAETEAVPITITGTGTSGATKLTVTVPQLYWSGL